MSLQEAIAKAKMNHSMVNHTMIKEVVSLETPKLFEGLSPGLSLGGPSFSGMYTSGFNLSPTATADLFQKAKNCNPFELEFHEANQIRKGNNVHDKMDHKNLLPLHNSLSYSPGVNYLRNQNNNSDLSPSLMSALNFLRDMSDSSSYNTQAHANNYSKLTQSLIEHSAMQQSILDSSMIPKTADIVEQFLDYDIKNNSKNFVNLHGPSSSSFQNTNVNHLNQPIPSINTSSAALSSISMPNLNNGQGSTTTVSKTSPKIVFPLNHINGGHINSSNDVTSSVAKLQNSLNVRPATITVSPKSNNNNVHQDNDHLGKNLMTLQPSQNHQHNIKTEEGISQRDVSSSFSSLSNAPASQSEYYPLSVNSDKSEKSSSSMSSNSNSFINGGSNQQNRGDNSSVAPAPRGRGRRSTTSDMPPDERRNTILERNKAAAVRYRKRKKEEHDDMMSKVNVIETEKSTMISKLNSLTREVDNLKALLNARDAQCHCRARTIGNSMNHNVNLDHLVNTYNQLNAASSQHHNGC
uniref:BZIP domain-containing protein n=1 Tax=Rhabditophanes sp. KR3021 TaxID=114890 RepID=A0AC35TN26_9BILA